MMEISKSEEWKKKKIKEKLAKGNSGTPLRKPPCTLQEFQNKGKKGEEII